VLPPGSAPLLSQHIETSSAHNVRLWMRKSIAEGRLRNCSNLDINIVEFEEKEDPRSSVFQVHNYSYFVPSCKHRSFISDVAHLGEQSQAEFLRYALCSNPVSCPKDCTYYENYRWGKLKSTIARTLGWFIQMVKSLFKGYAAFAWQTQVTLVLAAVLLLVLWKSPSWVPQLILLAKAVWGKS